MLLDREREDVSIMGKGARAMIRILNHLPRIGYLAQNGELRKRLSEREKEWVCPKGMMRTIIDREMYSMELLTGKLQEANETDEKQDAAEKDTIEEKTENKRLILHLHGGGYYGRLHNTYRDMAAVYHEISGGDDVLSIDYRVAPECPFPAALEDALDGYKWALEQGYKAEHIIIVGDSAGGGLTLALTLYLRDQEIPLPAAVITMSAWTDLTKSGWSYEEKFHEDPVFGDSKETLVYKEGYIIGNDPTNPYISPIFGDYTGFPPMLMQVGEKEMLLSDTLTVAEHAREQGVDIVEHTYTGMFHDFQMGFMLYQESRDAWNEISDFIERVQKAYP